jgi:hypothetical protein
VAKLLLTDPKVDPSSDSNYAFKIATQGGFFEIVKYVFVYQCSFELTLEVAYV